MKVVPVLLLSALLGAASASAADAQRESPREKALMLYFSKSFGGTSDARMPLAFGLRLQQSSSFDTGHAVALVDARYWLGGPRILALGGVPALSFGNDRDEEEEEETGSSGDLSGAVTGFGKRHPGWTIAAIFAAVLGGACLAEWGVCEDDPRDPEYVPPGTNPGTG
jgi:hypothetical protein